MQALVEEPTRRITDDLRLTPIWTGGIEPLLRGQIDRLQRVSSALQAIETPLAQLEDEEKAALVQPLFDLQRAIRRLGPVSTLIEWDDRIPPLATLEAEAARARAVIEAAEAARAGGHAA